MTNTQQITYAVLGYGDRGLTFSNLLREHSDIGGRVVAVAELNADKRQQAAEDCGLSPEQCYGSAEELLAAPRMADSVIVATLDQDHAESAIVAMAKGYHLLLEKPMATSLADCQDIAAAQASGGVVVGVCHSLRYHLVYARVREMIAAGSIGEVMSFEHLEGVEARHQAHSFVRGNWAQAESTCFMLMAKSCHDLDLFQFLFGRPCERVSSFGALTHFTAANKPEGAPMRCLDGCPAAECPYHAGDIYLAENSGYRRVFALKDDASVEQALRDGPYGRCVYSCDNDVVDHQVVTLEYAGGLTGSFTMTAFAPAGRHTRIHGTRGMLVVNEPERRIARHDLASGEITEEELPRPPGGHGGGDYLTILDLTKAIRARDPEAVRTGAAESLASHTIVFAAEHARLTKRVVELAEFAN
ncbi:MAG: putative dehydrogenase [Rhodothermales bacterium]|jgi:predicted dehydrogenase